jgi:hypothetical protein
MDTFVQTLDRTLKQKNSDYEAKRFKDMAMLIPLVRKMPKGTFKGWLKNAGKLGGQHKVPRLSNHRTYVEEILNQYSATRDSVA